MAEIHHPESDVSRLQIVHFTRKEALEVVTYLTALLADLPPTHGQSGAAPVVTVWKGGCIDHRLGFTVES